MVYAYLISFTPHPQLTETTNQHTAMLSIEMSYKDGYSAPDLIGGRELVEALMSGQYMKGTGQLASPIGEGTNSRYCCLGVKCKLDGILFMSPIEGMVAKYIKDDVSEDPCSLALPTRHPWTELFGQELHFPDGFSLKVYHTKNGKRIRGTSACDTITKVNDYLVNSYTENNPNHGSFSFTTIAAVLQTAWNCLPNTQLTETYE